MLELLDSILHEMTTKELANGIINYCYSQLDQQHQDIYDESLNLFPKTECIGCVLSILVMMYDTTLDIKGRDAVITAIKMHSMLYKPFVIKRSMCWTLGKLFDLNTETVVIICKTEFPEWTKI